MLVERLGHAQRQIAVWCNVPENGHRWAIKLMVCHKVKAVVIADLRGVFFLAFNKICKAHDRCGRSPFLSIGQLGNIAFSALQIYVSVNLCSVDAAMSQLLLDYPDVSTTRK